MASFFRSANDLMDWVKERGSADAAVEAIVNIPGVGTDNITDITEICKRVFSDRDSTNAVGVLFREILGGVEVTAEGVTTAVNKADVGKVADHLLSEGTISKTEHGKMLKEATVIRDLEKTVMPLRVCPKLPWSVGKKLISTYNCRHYCLDSLVLDDDPERVYCLETMWRRHVAHKFSREWKDRDTGRWVGGYLNERFHVFPDAGTPANPGVDRFHGNQMGLKPGERTRKPRPHQWSTERRLQEQRDPGSTESLVFMARGRDNFIKIASAGIPKDDDPMFEIFSAAADMHASGVDSAEAALSISETFGITVEQAVKIQDAAMRKVSSHQGEVYTMEKTSQIIPADGFADGGEPYTDDELDLMEGAEDSGLLENPECPYCGGPSKTRKTLDEFNFSCPKCGIWFSQSGKVDHP